MKKRLFAIMLALAMLLAAVPALAEEVEGGEAQTVESIKKECTKCKTKVDKVNEQGLCENCVSNLKQDDTHLKQNDTQQTMVTSLEILKNSSAEGGTNGGNAGDNTNDNTVNTDNTGGKTGDGGWLWCSA